MTCSAEALAVGEPLPGTAPFARAWIVIEQAGPWGRDALADGPLPPRVRDHLLTAKAHGVSVLLARHPDRPERASDGSVNVWIARSAAAGMLLRHGITTDLDPLAGWDLAAVAAGSLPAFGVVTRRPLLLVCTHGRRDQCCAVNGRPLLKSILSAATEAQRPRVWECSHVGGHRFAPVTVSLPSGTVHGRLEPDLGPGLLAGLDEHRVVIDRLRGRSCFAPPLQAAAIAVHATEGIDAIDDLDVLLVTSGRAVPAATGDVPVGPVRAEVRHRDGRAWWADVERVELGGPRPESCGAEPTPAATWAVRQLVPSAPWA